MATVQSSSVLKKHFDLSSSRKHHSSSSFQPMNAVDPFPENPTYMSLIEFSDFNCQSPNAVIMNVVNVCMASEKESIKYTCENGIVYKNVYKDTTCTTISASSSGRYQANQCLSDDGISLKYNNCDATNAYDYPKGNYFVETTYQSDTCNAEILETDAFVNGYCFPKGGETSTMFKWPYLYSYSNSGSCEGSGNRTDVSVLTCPLVFHSDDDDDYVDYKAYHSFSNVVVDGDDDKSDDSLSGWKIAVIVVCSVIGFVLIAGVAYYFLVMKKKSEPMSSQAKTNNSEV
eukprot:gene7153-7909_t